MQPRLARSLAGLPFGRRFAASLVLALVGSAPAHGQDLPARTCSYLGGAGDDRAGAVDHGPDGSLYFGGTVVGPDPGGVVPADVLGGGDGLVLRLTPDGRRVLSAARLGEAVRDLEVAADGTVLVAASGLGAVALAPVLDASPWHQPLADVERVAVGGGLRAALTAGKTVRAFDAAGQDLGGRTFTDSDVLDLAVAPDGQRIVVTGFNNLTAPSGAPVQSPFVRAYGPTLASQLWRAYGWSGSQLQNDQDGSLADCRGQRLAFGADGLLYFAGQAAGGNNTFRYDPIDVGRRLGPDELIAFDDHSRPSGISGSFFFTYFGRFDPATGGVLKLQAALSRLSSGNGNTVVPAAIDADADGRVVWGGQAFATIADRDAGSVGGVPVGPYQGGEAFVMVVPPDFQGRQAWNVFTAAGGSQGSVTAGVSADRGRLAWAASVNDTGRMILVDPLQAGRGAGREAYLGTLGVLFADGFESGGPGAWSSVLGAAGGP